MTERGPEPAQPEGAPPSASGWYARMERQSSTPQTPVGPPPTAPLVAAGPGARKQRGRRRKPPPGGHTRTPPRRRPSRAGAWWALGALILAVAAVVAIFFGDGITGGTPAADSQKVKESRAQSSAPTLPSVGESTETQTDTGATPADTATPTTASPTASGTGEDPLGVGVPMSPPACDGTWVVILGSATDPASYAEDVTALLGSDPEAKYALTQGACSSLRQQTAEGNRIYAVYLGPYPDQAAACATSTGIGGGVYVKRMDDITSPEQTWPC